MRHIKLAAGVELDLDQFIYSKALIQANSGGGKSYLIRKLAEQIAPHVPIIVLDWEGEFFTLREKFDLLIVGNDGELAIDVKTSALLARRLVEKSVSAVIDLSSFTDMSARRTFVRRFCESLLALPRAMWRPMALFFDEAHMLCPENNQRDSESRAALINIMSQGRKRGLCGIVSTQRISKLHKDAAAECNNVFIGRTVLDVDKARAADALGMSKKDSNCLMHLQPGEWRAFGPAFGVNFSIAEFTTDKTVTTHLSPAQRAAYKAPSPSSVIRACIGEFADLAKVADQEIRDMADARKRIAELEQKLRQSAVPAAPPPKPVEVRVPYIPPEVLRWVDTISTAAKALQTIPTPPAATAVVATPASKPSVVSLPKPIAPVVADSAATNADLKPVHKSLLTILAQYRDGMPKGTALIHTGYSNSGPTSAAWAALARYGFIESCPAGVRITQAGLEALGPYSVLPTGAARLAELLDPNSNELLVNERCFLTEVAKHYPDSVSKGAVLAATGYANSGPSSKAWSVLRRKGYIVLVNRGVRLSDSLVG